MDFSKTHISCGMADVQRGLICVLAYIVESNLIMDTQKTFSSKGKTKDPAESTKSPLTTNITVTFLSGRDKRGITVNYVSPSFCSDHFELIIISRDIWDTSDFILDGGASCLRSQPTTTLM